MGIVEFYVSYVNKLCEYLMMNAGGGPRPFQMRHIINLQKGSTLIIMFLCMLTYDNFSSSAWLYTSLHGSYGIVWILKDMIIRDNRWNAYVTLPSLFIMAIGMGLYWFPGLYLISHGIEVSPPRMALAIIMHTIGIVLMMAADTQKYFVLKLQKGLISDGWLARCRNTNYLGEILVYVPYAILGQHAFSWYYYILLWSLLFGSNMSKKETSFRRKKGGKEYITRSGLLFPNVLGWLWDNCFEPGSTEKYMDSVLNSRKLMDKKSGRRSSRKGTD